MLHRWSSSREGRPEGRVFGQPGRSAQDRFEQLAAQAGAPGGVSRQQLIANQVVLVVLAALVMALMVGALVGPLMGLLPAVVAGSLVAMAAVWWWWRRLPERPGELPWSVRAWQWGAEGERQTAALLDPMRQEGWTVFHDLACPGSRANIDHLAVGPNGLFVIDTKRWRAGRIRPGRTAEQVYVDDEERDLGAVFHEVRQAWQAVCDVAIEDDVGIRVVVAIHGATVPEGGMRSRYGDLIAATDLPQYLRTWGTGRLEDDQVAELARSIHRRFDFAA